MQTLIIDDLHHILSRLPRDVLGLLKKNPGIVLAGGFIRATIAGETPADIDLLGSSKPLLELVAKDFALAREARVHASENAYTVLAPGRCPVQFIHRWVYATPEEVVASFDFTVAMAAIWATQEQSEGEEKPRTKWHSMCHDMFYADLASRRLRYTCPKRVEEVGGSLLRARKFIKRGYHIEAGSLAAVVARLATGVRQVAAACEEEKLAFVLRGLLREVDPLRVIDGLDIVDEHESDAALAQDRADGDDFRSFMDRGT